MCSDSCASREQKKAVAKVTSTAPQPERMRSEEEITATIESMMRKAPQEVADADSGEVIDLSVHEWEAVKDYVSSEQVPAFKKIGNLPAVRPDHPIAAVGQALIAKALGITDEIFYEGALRQLIIASSEGTAIDVEALNFAVSLVRSIQPRNQLETMLAIQMAAVHLASMKYMRRMNHSQTIPQLDLHERIVNKLMRTFTSQMEALRKHRNGGNQRVTVKHVHVHDGGQAIVGNVSHGGRVTEQSGAQSHEQDDLSIPAGAAVRGNIEAD